MNIRSEDIKRCEEYANKNWFKFRDRSYRSKSEKIEHIKLGKIGEICAAEILKEKGLEVIGPFFDSDGPDEGRDLICNGEKTNVKSQYKEDIESGFHSNVEVNYQYDRMHGCQKYVLILISKDYSTAEYYGSFNLNDVQNPQNIDHYIPINLFK